MEFEGVKESINKLDEDDTVGEKVVLPEKISDHFGFDEQEETSHNNEEKEERTDDNAVSKISSDDNAAPHDEKMTIGVEKSMEKTLADFKEEITTKIETSLADFKEEMTIGVEKSMEKTLADFKEEMTIGVEKSMEKTLADFKEEVKDLKTKMDIFSISSLIEGAKAVTASTVDKQPLSEQVPIPPKVIEHPSMAISWKESHYISACCDKSTFHVSVSTMPLLPNRQTWIGGYGVITPSPFMDPESGIFTVPLNGNYRFSVSYKSSISPVKLFVNGCDQSKKSEYSKCSDTFEYSVDIDLTSGTKVWLEVTSQSYNYSPNDRLNNLNFKGNFQR